MHARTFAAVTPFRKKSSEFILLQQHTSSSRSIAALVIAFDLSRDDVVDSSQARFWSFWLTVPAAQCLSIGFALPIFRYSVICTLFVDRK